jgi:hypothetical protein
MGFKRVGSMCTERREKREETSIPGGTNVNEVFVRSTPKPMSTGHRSRSDHVHTLSYILNPREVHYDEFIITFAYGIKKHTSVH